MYRRRAKATATEIVDRGANHRLDRTGSTIRRGQDGGVGGGAPQLAQVAMPQPDEATFSHDTQIRDEFVQRGHAGLAGHGSSMAQPSGPRQRCPVRCQAAARPAMALNAAWPAMIRRAAASGMFLY